MRCASRNRRHVSSPRRASAKHTCPMGRKASWCRTSKSRTPPVCSRLDTHPSAIRNTGWSEWGRMDGCEWAPRGPAPRSLKVEPSGQGEKVTAEFVNTDGTRTTSQYTANFDGKDYPFTGSAVADTVSLKRIDARTTDRTDTKGGKVAQTLKRVVSQRRRRHVSQLAHRAVHVDRDPGGHA